ncbi:MAG: flagellar hook-associated protein 3 FlgL [Baekduia sp.]|nr:flagellar hook-associated protein 3 FlgL [Baekduia sp.]
MSMRLTNTMLSHRVMTDLQSRYRQMSATQETISTGKRVNRPSDDPTAAAMERQRTSDLEGVKRSQDSVAGSQSYLDAADSALSGVNNLLARASELAVYGANGSLSQDNRNSIAAEIDQLTKAAKDSLNVKFGDAYVLSGTKSDVPPYSGATGDAYQGDTGAIVREAGPGVSLQLNGPFSPLNAIPAGSTAALTADTVLGSGSAAGDGRVLATLEALSAHLRGGTAADMTALQTTDLKAIKDNQTALSDARATIGATRNRADAAASRLTDLEDATNQSLDDLTGVDLAKALTDFTAQQTAYQASLKVGAQIIQPSLLDFIR